MGHCHGQDAAQDAHRLRTVPWLDPRKPGRARGVIAGEPGAWKAGTPGSEGGCPEKAQVHWDLVGQPTLPGVTARQGERESRLQGQVAQVSRIIWTGGVCVMQRAEALLEIIHERGKRGLPLERLYRQLFNPELYLRAYGKIYRNDGSMTPGVNAETVDGMSLKKIQAIIDALRRISGYVLRARCYGRHRPP